MDLEKGNPQLLKCACLRLEKCEDEVLRNCWENLMKHSVDGLEERKISEAVCYNKPFQVN